jgi:hypothetical protein
MSPAEKGYLKKRARSFKTNSQNWLLYEAIEHKPEYDEEELRLEMGYRDSNKFAVAKNYLYYFILETLGLYNKDSPCRKVRNALDYIEILSNKGLDEQSQRILRKAKKVAQEYQLKKELLEINDWEVYFLMSQNQSTELFTVIQKQRKEFNRVITDIELEAQAKYTYNYIRNKHLVVGLVRSQEEIKELNELLASVKKTRQNTGKVDFLSSFYQFFALAVYYFTNNNFDASYKYALEIDILWNKNEDLKKLYPNLFLVFLTRKMLFEQRLQLRSKVYKTINEGLDFLNENQGIDNKTKGVFYMYILEMYNKFADYSKSLDTISKIEDIRKKLKNGVFLESDEQLYMFTISDTYFETGEYKKANQAINNVLNEKLKFRQYLYCYAFVKNIIIQFELNNWEFLPYKIKVTLSFLRKEKRLHAAELAVLEFIRKNVKQKPEIPIKKTEYRTLRKQLELILQDPVEKNTLNYFDFLTWIDAKISNVPFREIKIRKSKAILN